MYRLFQAGGGSLGSDEILAKLDRTMPAEARYAAQIERIERVGISYSNQDYDLLGGAAALIWRREHASRGE
jgi:hypothetical protein